MPQTPKNRTYNLVYKNVQHNQHAHNVSWSTHSNALSTRLQNNKAQGRRTRMHKHATHGTDWKGSIQLDHVRQQTTACTPVATCGTSSYLLGCTHS